MKPPRLDRWKPLRLALTGRGRLESGLQGPARWVAVGAIAIGVAYSLVVLATIATTGTLGVRCVLGTKVIAVGPNLWSAEPRPVADRFRVTPAARDVWSRTPPNPDDWLLDVGGRSIRNYHDYVMAARTVSRAAGQVVEVRWQSAGDAIHHVGQVRIERPPLSAYGWSLVWFAQEMVVFGLGLIVYWKRPRDESARLFFFLCAATVGAFMGGYHWTQIVVHPPLIYLFALFAVFVPVLSLHFYLVFPRVNPYFARHWRSILAALYGLPLAAVAAMWVLMAWAAIDSDASRVMDALSVLKYLALGCVRAAAVIFVLCLACLVYSFSRARSRAERNQVQWILLATLLSLGPISYLLWDTWTVPARLGLSSSAWPMFAVSLLYTTAYATSIMRYKLMQAETFLNRGVLYFVVSVVAGLLYSVVLIIATLIIGDRLLAERPSISAVVAALTAILLLVVSEAARHRFQVAIDRRFHRDKYKLDQAIRKMSQAVDSLVDRTTLGRRLVDAACDVLHLDWGAIYLRERGGGPLVLAACHGPQPEESAIETDNPLVVRLSQVPILRVSQAVGSLPDVAAIDAMIALGGEVAAGLQAEGGPAGLMVLGPKRSGLPFEDEEVGFLVALASVSALALRSADIQSTLEGLNHELRDKVEKIAEQRRRILVLQDQLAGRVRRDAAESLPAPEAPLETSEVDTGAFAAIKGSSRPVRRVVEMARKVAASPSAVLIRGESGTGKELLAEAIHRASSRAARPFVKVHCAALAQNLLESELFGHVKGAFTGADRDRIGRFQQADGGTLFLDEIGDINWEVQTKLLRVLQETAFERVGSSQTIAVDVRIIAATHQDLEALIRAGRFREDLYYRLNVISLRAPALRDRRDDIFELAMHFLNEQTRRGGKSVTLLDEAATEALIAYDWPGNIRELENVIERAVVLADGPAVTLGELPPEVRRPAHRRRRAVVRTVSAPILEPTSSTSVEGPDSLDREVLDFERQRLLDALEEAGGNKSTAARLLAMPRSTFFSKLRKHGLA